MFASAAIIKTKPLVYLNKNYQGCFRWNGGNYGFLLVEL
nr:MAG TPA_asm: hypothetical protein [Bacteriophage sp.]